MTIEYSDQSYYPSAKIRLIVRFDEFGTPALKGKAPKKTTPRLKGVKDERTPLVVQEVADPNRPGVTRFVLSAAQPTTKGAGTEQQKSSDNLTHEILGVIPKRATWKQNGIRTADTLSVSIRFQDMPVDPRTIRACAVEYYLGTVTATEFAEGIAGITRGDVFGTGVPNAKERMNIVADKYRDRNGKSRTNLRFQGWVDKYKLTCGEEEAMIELECVDNTRLLEKQVRPPKLVIGMEKPIDLAVAEYLSHFPQMDGLEVVYLPETDRTKIPKLKGSLAQSAFVPKFGPPGGNAGSTGGASETVLDYLTAVTGSIAHSVRFDGTTFIIQRPSNLFGSGPIPRESDPYQGRNLKSGNYPVRAFIYGKNIIEYSMEREYAKKEPKNIEVRSYDPQRKNVLVARFPEKGDRLVNSGPGDKKADNSWTVVQVSNGIRDKAVLKAVAEEVYNTTGRQELQVQIKTKNLASFGGDNEDTDLLDMTVGDAFEILVNKSYDEGTVNDLERTLAAVSLNEETMTSLGFTKEFATAYAKAFSDSGFQKEYKMKEMSVEWNVDEGVSFDIVGMNYIVARVDRITSAGTKR